MFDSMSFWIQWVGHSGPRCLNFECAIKQHPWLHIGTNQRGKYTPFRILICISAVLVLGPTVCSRMNAQTHTHTRTQNCQAKEEGGPLRSFKQKDIFRKVLLSGETKEGSDMTLHRRECEGHRWHDGHTYGTVSYINNLTLTHTHTHTAKVLCAALKIAISSSPILFADIRIIRMFVIYSVFPSAKSTRNPLFY